LETDRKAYIREQRERFGRHPFGVFPAQYPREILWAMNVLPVEIWDPPLEVSQANAHLQPYICSVVKLGLELILQGHCDDLEGFLFPHTCDSIQNLASIVHDYLDIRKPCYFFYHPKAPYGEASRRYYREELRELIGSLERQLGPLDPAELKRRVEQGRQVASLIGELYELRAGGKLDVSNEDFYGVVRKNEFLHPDDFIPLLERFLSASRGEKRIGKRVIMSGVLPNPPELLKLLDELDVFVTDDDLLSCSRRLLLSPSNQRDPLEALAEGYFSMAPCSTKDHPVGERLDWLLGKAEQGGAQGVLFCTVKFCEPELFDVPQLVEGLKERGLATLVIDTELNQGLSGQMITRVEAFVEILEGSGGAP
jgi:benzoyl-CoA reductase/2-hydroxyglutaryl-CoA dehydratase subunit BcrC/BadD/HgdB